MLVECTNIWLNRGLKDESQEIADWAKDSLCAGSPGYKLGTHLGSTLLQLLSLHQCIPNSQIYCFTALTPLLTSRTSISN